MTRTSRILLTACMLILGIFWNSSNAIAGNAVHALALHGEPKYGPDFKHLDYVNPDAPKGGYVRHSQTGTFDSLNPYILKGVSAAGLGGLFDTLTYQSNDEAFTEYGLLAESIEVAPDNAWVIFTLRPTARFHDGSQITVEDVIFSLEILKTKGHPSYRSYYADIERAEKVGDRAVKFIFASTGNRELPLIVGQLPVLPKAFWATREFEKTTLEAPLGSGPYTIKSVNPGRSITYQRNPEYWGRDLAVNIGRNNIDTIRYDYYRDGTVALEAFKAGEYDFRTESVSKNWAIGYNSPAFKQGLFKKENIRNEQPTGMQGFAFNIRNVIFQDPRVRQALAYAFDFEWTNKNLFYGAYTRTKSYFSNSELASSGLPSEEELKILEPYRTQLPTEVFTQTYTPPETDGSGNIRNNFRQALRLLKQAGWTIKNGRLVNAKTGRPMAFELLLVSPAFERIALPFKRNLKRLGIEMAVRTVDSAQYEKRVEDFDFDIIVSVRGQSLSPGNEQRNYWTSQKADEPGSQNLIGIKNPVIDKLVDTLINAPDRDSLIHRTRALDRVLLWGHYVIPHWHIRDFRVAYWDKFSRPAVTPKYALGFDAWWIDSDKEATLNKRRGKNPGS